MSAICLNWDWLISTNKCSPDEVLAVKNNFVLAVEVMDDNRIDKQVSMVAVDHEEQEALYAKI